jgi:O-antigen/teichoic acid export membrane protein
MSTSTKKKILQGSAANLLQVALSFGISLIVPPFLVHHMQQAEYSAWVLILQISAYINYLEVGLQTAIGKYVAEFNAAGDAQSCARVAGTAFSLLSIGAALGITVTGVLAWLLPLIFHQVPAGIIGPMRLGVLAIGITTALMLPFMVMQAVFVGLQRYGIPALISSISRVGTAVGIIVLLLLHGGLAELALLMACFNLATIAAQWYCWKQFANTEVPLRIFTFDRGAARRLLEYCSVLSIWTIGILLISGLDTVIVGRYDFHNTGFYGIAGSATNFMLLIVGSALGPLMPAISSVQGQRTPKQLGALLVQATRYCTLMLMVLGIPLLVAGFPILRIWLGPVYANGSVRFLIVLVLANIIRELGYPYALMVVATGSQRLATISPIVEGLVNLGASLLLVRMAGAIGVAYGTLIGAVVGFCIHLLVSMRLTMPVIALNRLKLLIEGVLRPGLCALPSLVVLPWLHCRALLPLPLPVFLLWALTTLAIAWAAGLTLDERQKLLTRARATIVRA